MLHYNLLRTWPSTPLKVFLFHFSTNFLKFLLSHFMYFLIRILHNAAAVLFESCFQPSALPAQPVEPWDCTGIWYIPVTSILIFSLPPFPPSICPLLICFICYLCFTLLYISLSQQNHHFVWRLYDGVCNAFPVEILHQIPHFPFTF